jgi:hypothetical protein
MHHHQSLVYGGKQMFHSNRFTRMYIQKPYRLLVLLFFLGYFLLGLAIYDDYGLSWDEPSVRFRGMLNYQYAFEGRQELLQYDPNSRYHGPIFEILLISLEKALRLTELREIYFMRHLVTFFLFYSSVWFFYLLCKERFDSWKIGLLGSLFFIVSPRIFAHSFYNSKDIPFLAVFVISIYTLLKYLEKRTIIRTLLHALSCAILIDIRILGLLVPSFTFFLVIGRILSENSARSRIKQELLFFVVYMIFCLNLSILFFPILWENPVHHLIQSFVTMKQYNWVGTVLYFGKHLAGTELPWHYLPVWIGITTPLLYIAGFFIGIVFLMLEILRRPLQVFQERKRQYDCLMILWCLLPILLIIGLKSVVYDAWRHVFFIYPAFLIISLHGLIVVKNAVEARIPEGFRNHFTALVLLFVFLNLAAPIHFMIRYHPYQNLYFNVLAGRDMQTIKQNFDLDYWGLSYREALEYIVRTEPGKSIKIYDSNMVGEHRLHILEERDRKRITIVNTPDEAEYFISNYRWHKEDYPYENEVFSVEIRGVKIMVVYKL